jgi:hypothetical protein
MFISHKSNVLQTVHETEWECRKNTKGLTKLEYWTWLDSVTTVTGTPPDAETTVDLSGETGYTLVECTDEDVSARLNQLGDYVNSNRKPGEALVYNIKYSASKKDSEIVDVEAHTIAAHTIAAHRDEDGNDVAEEDVAEEDVATTYVQTHLVGDDTAKDARLLAEEWTRIRAERDSLLTSTDWTQSSDTALASAKVTAWGTYRTKLRTLPVDQSSKTTYADITWPPQPS